MNTLNAEKQAKAQLQSIMQMVAALEVDYDRLEELRNQEERTGDEKEELAELEEAAGDCESREDAEQRIQEDPLEVSVRSGWHTPGSDSEPEEYRILLCWGGPSCQIVGQLGKYNEPDTADIQYQDWFTCWDTLPLESDEQDAVLTYARRFYFGD